MVISQIPLNFSNPTSFKCPTKSKSFPFGLILVQLVIARLVDWRILVMACQFHRWPAPDCAILIQCCAKQSGQCVFGPERGGLINPWLPKGHDVLVGSDTLFPGFRFTLSQQVVGVHGVQKAWL